MGLCNGYRLQKTMALDGLYLIAEQALSSVLELWHYLTSSKLNQQYPNFGELQ
jgi:hypothetical protein